MIYNIDIKKSPTFKEDNEIFAFIKDCDLVVQFNKFDIPMLEEFLRLE